MIAHIVLFRPKDALSVPEREALVDALAHACGNIAGIARARVGRRRLMGRPYDSLAAADYPYVAILEFESEADLRAYLDHPAHEALGAQFYQTSAAAIALDFELIDGGDARRLLA